MNRTLAALVAFACASPPAFAWKIDTHLWLADRLWGELASGEVSTAPLGKQTVPLRVNGSIRSHRSAFLLGVLGPDLYPDMVSGQMTVHPGLTATGVRTQVSQLHGLVGLPIPSLEPAWKTDDWLDWVRDRAFGVQGAGEPPPPRAEVAFAMGYLIHAAMDTWAHSYVNTYAGDVFTLTDEQEVEFRHMAIESAIKHTHESFVAPSQEISQKQAVDRLARGAAGPQTLARQQTDTLSALHAPVPFVRRYLVLDPKVAYQYARETTTLHLWGMYFYWSQIEALRQQLGPLRNAVNGAAAAAEETVNQAQSAFNLAQSAYDAAVDAAGAAHDAFKTAESNALAAADQFNATKNQVLQMIGALTDQLIATLPPAMRQAYYAGKAAAENADKALDTARASYEQLAAARDQQLTAMNDAAATLNLRKATRDSLRGARDQAMVAVDGGIGAWKQGVERAVDAYIQAWEDTGKELMRPPGNRFSPGGDATAPLKQWVLCWGPTFGLPFSPAVSGTCDLARSSFLNVSQNLDTLLANALIGPPLRDQIVAFDEKLAKTAGELLAGVAGLVSQTIRIDNGALAGYARSIVNLRAREVTLAELDDEFDDNTAQALGKNLVVYNQPGAKISALLAKDVGFSLSAVGQPFEAYAGFAAMQNSMTFARLTLLDGAALNGIAATANGGAKPPYRTGALPGEVLIGALRSIDGDYQWQRVAPQLPPRISNAGGVPRVFGYDANDGAKKPGLRFWQDTALRQSMFNKLFKGPLTPALVDFFGPTKLAQGIGLCPRDPYPPVGGVDGCRTAGRTPASAPAAGVRPGR